jgi:hypothetical protein
MILVQTKDGFALRGAARVFDDCIVLAACTRLDGDQPVELGGEVIVLRENVSFFQTVNGAA